MGGPTFAHIQTWARKANKAGQSVAQVIAEATRDPAYSTHVGHPAPPRVLIGNPGTFEADHDAHVAARATRVELADGSVRSRSIRKDRHTMASVIMSYPVPRAAIITDEARAKLASWERRNLEWLRDTYGDQLRVVLAHDDEPQPHLHAWILPDDPGADATILHPGKTAKKQAEAEAKAAGSEPREAVKIGNRALKEAMTDWQDHYYQAVGVLEGLTRTGPKRRRLNREQWKAEKAAAASNALALKRAEEAEAIRASADEHAASVHAKEKHFDEHVRQFQQRRDQMVSQIKSKISEINDVGRQVLADRKSLDDERIEIADERRDLETGQRELVVGQMRLAADRAEVERLRERLRRGLLAVARWLRRPDLTAEARANGQHLVRALAVPSSAGSEPHP